MDYDDNNKTEEDGDEEYHHEEAKDGQYEEELKEQEQIDPNKVGDIISDARENNNPIMHEEEQQPEQQLEQLNGVQDKEDNNVVSKANEESQATESSRRLTLRTIPIERVEPTLTGKSYIHIQEWEREYCHII